MLTVYWAEQMITWHESSRKTNRWYKTTDYFFHSYTLYKKPSKPKVHWLNSELWQ